MKKWLWCIGLIAGTAACPPPFGSVENFKDDERGGIRRAAYELECPRGQLEVTDLGDRTMGVSGCGKKAIYKWSQATGWINNSGSDALITGAPKK